MSRGNRAGISKRDSVSRAAGGAGDNEKSSVKQLHSSAEGGAGGTVGTRGTEPF
jgi:hypothetical protein